MAVGDAISGDRTVIKKEAEKILEYADLTIEIQRMWDLKMKVMSSNNRENWNHLKFIHKTLEQYTGRAENQGTTENKPYWAPHTYCWK